MFVCFLINSVSARADESSPKVITIIPQDGFNMTVDDQVNDHYVITRLTSPAHNWFAGTFADMPTDKDVTVGLAMAGRIPGINKLDVSKWEGLRPVITYGDPMKYETYEWFEQDVTRAMGEWGSLQARGSEIRWHGESA